MTSAPAMPTPTPIPAPPNFPIEWPAPEVALATWQQDRMHAPRPMTPMAFWWSTVFARGFTSGFAANSVPMATHTVRLNTYFFMSIAPNVPPEMMPELEPRAEAALMQAALRFWDRWQNEWLPELKQMWDEWNAHDLESMSDEELTAFVDRAAAWYERAWHIHFEMLIPAMTSASTFQDFYGGIFPDRDPLSAYKLLQGLPNVSLEAGHKLWELSCDAGASPALRQVIVETPTAELWDRLGQTEEARAFRDRLSEYIAFYGRRSDTVQEVANPSWTDDPQPVLDNLKAYVLGGSEPEADRRRLAAEREAAIAEAREAIQDRPAEFRGQFEMLLAGGQHFSQVQEDHNFWIDQRSLHEARRLCLEIGRRLAARGRIATTDDVFMLDMNEAVGVLRGGDLDAAAVAAARRAEIEHWATVEPPPFAGTDYGPPPDNPITRSIMRFFAAPIPQDVEANKILGNSGSPGIATGRARIVMTIADIGKLENGDILVAPTTAPPWTPLFATAAAVVTETGGVLSHCAIVAREYAIPAVVGATGATALIPDGALIEVDGDAGTIRVLE